MTYHLLVPYLPFFFPVVFGLLLLVTLYRIDRFRRTVGEYPAHLAGYGCLWLGLFLTTLVIVTLIQFPLRNFALPERDFLMLVFLLGFVFGVWSLIRSYGLLKEDHRNGCYVG